MSLTAKEQFHQHIEADGFRLRGLGFSRIDGFSDVVFGFALTLLVVSLEVPKTFEELHTSLRGFFPFAVCFLFLMMVWYAHYKFFRRFHLHDLRTLAINSALLFVVLFYVYPLKFLFTMIFNGMFEGGVHNVFTKNRQVSELMVLFGLGFAVIYLLIGLLYVNAYRQRVHLELTPFEEFLTRTYIVESLIVGSVGLLSCTIALLLASDVNSYAGWAGLTFWLIAPFKRLYGNRTRREAAALRVAEELPPLDSAQTEPA